MRTPAAKTMTKAKRLTAMKMLTDRIKAVHPDAHIETFGPLKPSKARTAAALRLFNQHLKPWRWVAVTGRSESLHKNEASARVIAGKRGKVVPVYR